MTILKTINLVLLTLMGIGAGVAKVMQTPQELEFFAGVGLNGTVVVVFGVAQIVGGVLLVSSKTRKVGAAVSAVFLCLSAVMIFRHGQVAFGLLSLLPVVMAGIVLRETGPGKQPPVSS